MINESAVDIATKAWARMKYTQKKQLLKNIGYSPSFAKAKTMYELVERGGGSAAHSFKTVVLRFKEKNKQYNRIDWR